MNWAVFSLFAKTKPLGTLILATLPKATIAGPFCSLSSAISSLNTASSDSSVSSGAAQAAFPENKQIPAAKPRMITVRWQGARIGVVLSCC